MPVVFTVGPGGTHANLQAAWNAIPEPLDDRYIIRLKNQEHVVTGAGVNLVATARTTSPTNDIIIEPEPGAGWKDHPNARTAPYRYDASRGAALRCQNNSAIQFSGVVNHLTIRGLQIIQESTVLSSDIDVLKSTFVPDTVTNRVLQDLIVEVVGADVENDAIALGGNNKVINCLVIHRGSNPTRGILLNQNAAGQSIEAVGCTVVRPSNLTPLGVGLANLFGGNTFVAKNCAVFGYLTDAEGLSPGTDYNATSFPDAASGFPDPGDNDVHDVPYNATTFEQTSDAGGNHDFRPKAGSALENAGIFDSNYPNDATGTARGDPPEIGAWDFRTILADARISMRSALSAAASVARQAAAVLVMRAGLLAGILPAPLAIDDRIFALPSIGLTKTGVKIKPVVIGDDFRVKRTYTGLPAGVVITKAWFTVKKSEKQVDADGLMQFAIAPTISPDGQITDANTTGGDLAGYFDLSRAKTASAKPGIEYLYDIQVKTGEGLIRTFEMGTISFIRGVTDATS